MPILDGWIAGANGMRRGRVRFEGSTIIRVDAHGPARREPDDDAPRILPGFVDAHVHGGGGGDAMDGPAGVRCLARNHLRHGTTTLLPTTITAPWPDVLAALRGVGEVRDGCEAAAAEPPRGEEQAGGEALPDLPGAHLEGPFINPERLGAQPPHALLPDPTRAEEVVATGVVRVVTLAPELPGCAEMARIFARAGVRVSIGHTRAGAEQVADLVRAVRQEGGTVGFTHLYNAMGGLTGRDPGVVGACFADPDAFAELILDGHHVHDTAFLAARAAKPDRLHLVTDAIRACGLPEGPTELGGQPVTVSNGAARLGDGTLAGSVLTLDAALRRAVAAGVPLAEASTLASAVPSSYLGLADRGRIEAGARADLVVLDPDLRVVRTVAAGRELPGAG